MLCGGWGGGVAPITIEGKFAKILEMLKDCNTFKFCNVCMLKIEPAALKGMLVLVNNVWQDYTKNFFYEI